ncbi:uncharacterized protein IUM83_17901 [Phytophthora cinnamomi]|uniref:uncharacterized protein n=1 Tax=Phytophthora cinnamomi TaxID=4785 RepID=UPI002A2A1458|nr:hypothetical protein IUM83_17901 [Phytophthora cinnamomi]KAJ8569093.1 hypothetical protein ON010_g6167 [Phytophthora cinnamomi]
MNVNQLQSVNCHARHPNSPRTVKAIFPSVFCWSHSRNQAPAAGWSYITAEGAAMVSILRCYEWFVEAMDELRTRELEQQMSGVEIEDEGTETNAEDDETKEN